MCSTLTEMFLCVAVCGSKNAFVFEPCSSHPMFARRHCLRCVFRSVKKVYTMIRKCTPDMHVHARGYTPTDTCLTKHTQRDSFTTTANQQRQRTRQCRISQRRGTEAAQNRRGQTKRDRNTHSVSSVTRRRRRGPR